MTAALTPTKTSRDAAHRTMQHVALHQAHQGVVIRYNAEKGFGFISVAPSLKLTLGLGLENDLYVNCRQLQADCPPLNRGMKVVFRVGKNKHGWQATNVQLVEHPTPNLQPPRK